MIACSVQVVLKIMMAWCGDGLGLLGHSGRTTVLLSNALTIRDSYSRLIAVRFNNERERVHLILPLQFAGGIYRTIHRP